MTQAVQLITAIDPIGYATPVPRAGPKVWAAAVIVFAGMALIVLGGCFLIGVLLIVNPAMMFAGAQPSSTLTGAQLILMAVLYALAFGCFGGALALIVSGLRNLYAVLRQS